MELNAKNVKRITFYQLTKNLVALHMFKMTVRIFNSKPNLFVLFVLKVNKLPILCNARTHKPTRLMDVT